MTGPRRLRGRLDDDRRDGDERPTPQPIGVNTELEELSVARVTARGRSRPGLQTMIVAGGLIALLAVGFGAFGGRRDRSDGPGSSATTSAPTPPTLAAGQTPAVTPWIACAAPPQSIPAVVLEVGDAVAPATVEVRERPVGVTAPPAAPGTPPPGGLQRTSVPPTVPVHIRIAGAACAHAWTIKIGSVQLDALGNAGLNPAYAGQNRFELVLAPYRDSVTDLTADLVFQTMSIRATWPLIVEPYPTPVAYVESQHQRWQATDDMDAFVHGDTVAPSVAPRERLSFSVAGWRLETANLWCGHMDGLEFVVDARAGCTEERLSIETVLGTSLTRLRAPSAPGTWTLAISACVLPSDLPALGMTCGTWYAKVEVGR